MGLIVGKQDFQTKRIRPYGIESTTYSELRKGDLFMVKSSGTNCVCKAEEDATKYPDGSISVKHGFVVLSIIGKDYIREVTTYGERDRT